MLSLQRSPDLSALAEPLVSAARLRAFGGILLLLIGLLLGRLWFLQVLNGDQYRQHADGNRSHPVRLVAPRGAIEDAQGRVLVTNAAQFTVFIDPVYLPKEPEERAAVLAEAANILQMPPDTLAKVMRRNASRGAKNDPVPIKEGVTMRELSRIAENRWRLPGIHFQNEPRRAYPGGQLAAHLLGSIGQIDERDLARKENRDLGYKPGDFIGKSGVERQYDRYLNGTAGGTTYEVDARGRRQRELKVEDPAAGATLRLSLNKDVQLAAEQAMAGQHGAAVALDPRDGRILAMTSLPAYDPNLFAKRPLLKPAYNALMDPKNNFPLVNRAVSSPQPPGSTFKIVTAAAGLATGKITAHTTDYCAGGIPLGGRIKRCHSRHGGVNLESAIAASCDVFFYHAGWRINPTPLAKWAESFGLGAKTGIDLPSEKAGTVPSPAWKAIWAPKFGNPETGWYPGDTANMSIGQGDLQTTPLQMALVAAAIGNNGVIYKPHVVDTVLSADKKVLYQHKPEILRRLDMTPAQLRLVANGMRSVVAGPRGTSRRAALPGIAVAGKSGSAETRGGGPTHAWFIAYAPYDRPTIAVCVFLETRGKGLHGGSDAAPVSRAMMAAHFKVKNQEVGFGGRVVGD